MLSQRQGWPNGRAQQDLAGAREPQELWWRGAAVGAESAGTTRWIGGDTLPRLTGGVSAARVVGERVITGWVGSGPAR
jgi:hypothetical protein